MLKSYINWGKKVRLLKADHRKCKNNKNLAHLFNPFEKKMKHDFHTLSKSCSDLKPYHNFRPQNTASKLHCIFKRSSVNTSLSVSFVSEVLFPRFPEMTRPGPVHFRQTTLYALSFADFCSELSHLSNTAFIRSFLAFLGCNQLFSSGLFQFHLGFRNFCVW